MLHQTSFTSLRVQLDAAIRMCYRLPILNFTELHQIERLHPVGVGASDGASLDAIAGVSTA